MKQIPLGKTGRDVSALCLGCMFFGTLTAEETAYQVVWRIILLSNQAKIKIEMIV